MISYAEAKAAVEERIKRYNHPFQVQPGGLEDDEAYLVPYGSPKTMEMPLDTPVMLVSKATGRITEAMYLPNRQRIRAMKPIPEKRQ